MDKQEVLQKWLDDTRKKYVPMFQKKARLVYDLTRQNGKTHEEAILDTIAVISYLSFESACIMPQMMEMGYDQGQPKTKDEMRSILKLVHDSKDDPEKNS